MANYMGKKPWGPIPVALVLVMLFLVHSSSGLPEEKSKNVPHRCVNADKTSSGSNGDNKKREINPELPPEQPNSPTKRSLRLRRSPLQVISGLERIRNQRKDSGSKTKLLRLIPSTRRKRAVPKDDSSPEAQFYTPSPLLAHFIKERGASKQGQSGKHLCPLLRRQKIRKPPPRQGRNVRHRFTNPDAASNPENDDTDRRASHQPALPASPLMLDIPNIRRHRAVRRDVEGAYYERAN